MLSLKLIPQKHDTPADINILEITELYLETV